MPTQPLLDPRELPLGMHDAHDAASTQALGAEIRMVRDVKLLAGLSLEALGAAPRHVLDGEQRAVDEQDVVEVGVHDDSPVQGVDDAG